MNSTATLSVPSGAPVEAVARAAPSSEFLKLLGLRITEWEDGRCVIEIPVAPQLTNVNGSVSGAVVGAAVDMAGGLAGCWAPAGQPPHRVVTLTFTVSFMASTCEGVVRAVAIKQGGGNKIFTSTVTATASDGTVLAAGQGIFRYIQ
jgi:uncharacterized protein (TIGR00369 family)